MAMAEWRSAGRKMQAYRIKAVLFDFDGTLTKPGAIDFKAVKRSIGCPPDQAILEFIGSLRDDARQAEAPRSAQCHGA